MITICWDGRRGRAWHWTPALQLSMLHICMHNNYFLHSQRTYQLFDGLGSPLQNEEKRCPKKHKQKKNGKFLR